MAEDRFFCFLSSSKRSLLEEINAISIPEKKAENTSAQKMYTIFSKLLLSIIQMQIYNNMTE